MAIKMQIQSLCQCGANATWVVYRKNGAMLKNRFCSKHATEKVKQLSAKEAEDEKVQRAEAAIAKTGSPE